MFIYFNLFIDPIIFIFIVCLFNLFFCIGNIYDFVLINDDKEIDLAKFDEIGIIINYGDEDLNFISIQ